MKAEIGIVGHFGMNKRFYDGQTIKTRILYDELKKRLNDNQILYVDTYNWKKNILKTLINSLKLTWKCKKIIINTSKNGRHVFIPFYYF